MSEKKEIKFEEANKELDILIQKLESENLTLEESIKTFKKADELLKICEKDFNSAEGKLLVIKNGIEQKLKDID